VQGLSVFVREEGACVDAVEGGFNDGFHNPAPLELGLRLPSLTPPNAMVARARPAACAALAAEDAIVCLMYRHSAHCGAKGAPIAPSAVEPALRVCFRVGLVVLCRVVMGVASFRWLYSGCSCTVPPSCRPSPNVTTRPLDVTTPVRRPEAVRPTARSPASAASSTSPGRLLLSV
jgi:hypothetical protein